MINADIHKKPVALQRDTHRALRLDAGADRLAPAAGVNAFFLQAVEFGEACKEYPIVFVPVGKDPQTGEQDVAPVAVFGLQRGENLYWQDGRWRAEYVPALLRAYPFALMPTGRQDAVLAIDEAWSGFSTTEGTPLFEADGEPSVLLKETQQFLDRNQAELQRTRALGRRLLQLGLLQSMRFEATLPGGAVVRADGFLSPDEKKMAALPDATVVELYRNGILALLQAQQLSLGHMRRLAAWRQARST